MTREARNDTGVERRERLEAITAGGSYLDAYRVDRDDNFYSCLQRLRGYRYDDALLSAPPDRPAGSDAASSQPLRLFMPGCSLATYSKPLTDAVYGHLRQSGAADGLSIACCGSILQFAAGSKQRLDYQRGLAERLNSNGVCKLITACPGCYYGFLELVEKGLCTELEVLALPKLLAEQGVLPKLPSLAPIPAPASAPASAPAPTSTPAATVSIHDSCPDRRAGVFAESVRALFAGFELREMRHNRRQSRCCGLGRLLPLRNRRASQDMAEQRLEEFQQSGADFLVTYCLNCSQPLQTAGTYHYLELLFGLRLDWQELAALGAEAMEVMSLSR